MTLTEAIIRHEIMLEKKRIKEIHTQERLAKLKRNMSKQKIALAADYLKEII